MAKRRIGTILIGLPVVQALINPAVLEVWPQIAPPYLTGPAFTALAAAVPSVAIMGLIAYFVPEAATLARVVPKPEVRA